MNEFEQDMKTNRNDFLDSAVGFMFSFGFFVILFIIATVVKMVG